MHHGICHPDFAPLADLLNAQLRQTPGGAAVCVYHHGEPVVDLWGGARDRDGTPWTADTMALSFSTTKGVASTLFHVLAHQHNVRYDDRVTRYWPEFGANGKGDITLRHLLSHTSGLYAIRDMVPHAQDMLDWQAMVAALEAHAPAHDVGDGPGYHALTYGWLIGELIERISGQRFSDALRTHIAEPLKLDGAYCGVPGVALGRVAQLDILAGSTSQRSAPVRAKRLRKRRRFYNRLDRVVRVVSGGARSLDASRDALTPHGMADFDFNAPDVLRASIPAANGVFTAHSLARVYAMLAGFGQLDGVRLLPERRVAMLAAVQNRASDRVLLLPMGWRLGYHSVAVLGALRSPRGFGHAGFGGSGAWADPARNLAAAMILNTGSPSPLGDGRLAAFTRTALRCADARDGALLKPWRWARHI